MFLEYSPQAPLIRHSDKGSDVVIRKLLERTHPRPPVFQVSKLFPTKASQCRLGTGAIAGQASPNSSKFDRPRCMDSIAGFNLSKKR